MHVERRARGLAALAGMALAALALALAPAAGRADCAAPLGYRVTFEGTTATVCGYLGEGLGCPGQGLVRRDATSGEAVLITTCDAGGCYVDECVPPGTYQYGRADPYACSPGACGTYYYETAAATADAAGCTRSAAAPAALTGAVPWGASDLVCAYQVGHNAIRSGCASGGAPGAGPVLAVNGLALAAGLWLLRRRARRAAPRA